MTQQMNDVQPGINVVAAVEGREVTGRVMSTAHRGTTLLSIGFYSTDLGHVNRIDDAILVHASDVVRVL